jgi:hypothetical protein
MNNQQNREADPLSRYFDPKRIEKAPPGFTSKVMATIRNETVPAGRIGVFHRIKAVPAISVGIILAFIMAAFFLPGVKNDPYALIVNEQISNIKFSLPDVDLSPIFNHNFPEVLMWVIGGLIILSVFDRALSSIIRRL